MPEKRQLTVQGPGGSADGARKTTCSSSSTKDTAQDSADASASRISTSLMARSAAFSTISVTGSWTTTSTETVPEKLAEATLGSTSMRYLTGSTVRGRRNASGPGTAEEDVSVVGRIAGRLPGGRE